MTRATVLQHRLAPSSVLLGLVSALLLAPGGAWAGVFTVANPIVIDGTEQGNPAPSVVGTIRPVTDLSGSTTDLGTVNFASQDVFVVDVVLNGTSNSIDEIGISVISTGPGAAFFQPQGAGYFDSLVLQEPNTSVPPFVLLDNLVQFNATFLFNTDAAGLLSAGETSTRLFITHTLGNVISGDQANFTISRGTNFTVTGTVVAIPAPAP